MPKLINKKASAEKSKSEIAEQTLVNLTEVLIFFDGMDKNRFFEMTRESNPPFPSKVTRTQWSLPAIRKWLEIYERFTWWVDPDDPEPDDDGGEALARYDSKVAA